MNKNIFKKIIFIFIIFGSLDFFLTNYFLKKKNIWKSIVTQKQYWRISSDIYDHDLKPNVNVMNKWQLYNYSFYTNSIGFRDSAIREIKKKNNNKKRILLIGDSFVEGMGYDYQDTLAGIIEKQNENKFEILNSAVASYSPSIYYLKTKYYLDRGYKFDKAFIFLDISDIYDELYYNYDLKKNIIINNNFINQKNNNKNKIYKLFSILSDNTVTFQFLLQFRNQIEVLKNYLKIKYKAAEKFNKSFFKITQEDALFYRMLMADRGDWTYDNKKFFQAKEGIDRSKYFLEKLFVLLNDNKIQSYLIIYPWPNQIYFGDNYHQRIWKNFANEHKINFINLYDQFNSTNKKNFILENFILGDIHWNKNGVNKIYSGLKKNNVFD